ncbi:SET domain-containing protein [Wenzhouxiangella sp. AB-CW3]|uniref:SET domain-containing protein n=1 Tax=Wenzhouxiangella sp. AB-CW3 TaxID=2771012 RepID=UPI00168BF919|nr:SET domain-containing protein [Wenzhouxiangella sp. AB-CW3]QOC21928.1 SET domain-containing protein [Wenzhouxiangella sp. AB-CW3]
MSQSYDDNPLVYVDDSPIHGRGVFARHPIARDVYIGTYEGPATDSDGMHVLWLWNEERKCWEGIDGKNELRFLNHSAKPNADWWGNELYAIRNIAADEEITFDYGWDEPE